MSEQRHRLPEGWSYKNINELCDNISLNKIKIKQKDYSPKGKYPVVDQGQDLIGGYYSDESLLVPNEPPYIIFGDHTKVKKYINFKFIAGADGVKVLKSKPDVDSKFLYYTLCSVNLENKGYARHFQLLKKIDFPVPSLPTQQAIVSKVEELFSELNNGIAQLETARKQLRVYRQSVLKWAFEGRLTNDNVKEGALPEEWKWVTIKEIAEDKKHALKAGPFGSSLKKEFYVEDGYKVYGQEQVINGDPYFGDYYISTEKYEELKSNKVKAGDILISLVGTVGKVLILPENCKDGIINPRLIKISLDTTKYLPGFFKYYFESSAVRSYYSSKAQGTTMDVLNLGIIKTVPFPLCSTTEQHWIIEEIERRLSVADKLQETIDTALAQSESLRQSILKKAFEGKLARFSGVKQPAQKEKKVIPQAAQGFPRKVSGISAVDLQAGIIAMVIEAHEDNPKHSVKLNHVKCEKISDLVERKLGISLGRTAVKDAAGPDDYSHLKKVEHRAHKIGAFRTEYLFIGHTYRPMRNVQKAITKVREVLTDRELSELDQLIETFLPFELEHAELVATLFAGWNNLLLQGKSPSDEDIVYESRENWSNRKLRIERAKFFKTLKWMGVHGYIPKGVGQMVLKPERKRKKK